MTMTSMSADQAPGRSGFTADSEREGERRGTVLVFREMPAGLVDPARRLTDAGWPCVVALDSDRARWLASVRKFALIVVAGQTVPWSRDALNVLRPLTMSPILALSPDGDEVHALLLRDGADGVLGGNCGAELFHSTAQALVRRTTANEPVLRYLEAEGLRIDLWGRRTTLDGHDIKLTPTEFDVLRFLMAQSQVAVKHHEIIKAVWNWKYADERNPLRLQINRLRSKLTDVSGRPSYIKSVRGIGYVFDKPVAEYADDRDKPRGNPIPESLNLLLEARLRSLIKSLIEAGGRAEACAVLVETVVEAGMCDAAAVFARRPDGGALDLVVQSGMPAEWQRAVAGGLALDGRYLAIDTFNSREIRNYVDISRLTKRFGPSVRFMREAQMSAQLSVPLVDHNGAWGQLGYARRPDSAFTTAQCMVLEAAGAVLGALFASPG